MAAPSTPSNIYVQQANGQVLLSWDLTAGATSYEVFRSTDQLTYASIATPTVTQYVDTAVTIGVQYFYKLTAVNGLDSSPLSSPFPIIPTLTAQMSLGGLRLLAQQRADRVNSNFVTVPEWNVYINQSAYELYDLLVSLYEDYFLAPVVTITTDGVSNRYALPNGVAYSAAPPLYKLMGVDLGLAGASNAFATLRKFNFIDRNRYVFPSITSTFLGVFNLQYRMLGNEIEFIPTPQAGQSIRLWYIPKLRQMLLDTDMLDGVSGWTEYVIVDAAIKALMKEESDAAMLMAQKQELVNRINASAMNRDAGAPDTISNTRSWGNRWGAPDSPWGGGFGGY